MASSPQRALRLAAVALVLLVVLNISQNTFRRLYFSKGVGTRGYMEIGLWARNEFKAGTVIGAPQSGAIGYFGESLVVVNLDGVVSKSCYNSIVERKLMEYVRSVGVEYVITWDMKNEFLANNSIGFKPNDIVFIKTIEELETWNHRWHLMKVNSTD